MLRATGETDLQRSLLKLHQNILGHKMYIHGGTGNGTKAESRKVMFTKEISVYQLFLTGQVK